MISGLRALGVTVFLTTHYMDEAEHLADRVAVIAEGRIVAEGTPATLGGREHAAVEIRFSLPPGTAARRPARAGAERAGGARRQPVLLRARLAGGGARPADRAGPRRRGVDLADLDVRRPSLEDVYLALTERQTRGQP